MWKTRYIVGWLFLLAHTAGITAIGQAQTVLVGDCVALEFIATDCETCRAMDAATQQAIEDGWVIRRIDVRQEPQLAERWRIHSTPTTLLLRGGREVDRILGAVDLGGLTQRMVAASNPDHLKPSLLVRNQSRSPVPRANTLLPMMPVSNAGSTSASPELELPKNPASATVRIRVMEAKHEAVGTGTIVDSYQGEALVITCGHLFRDMTPQAKVTIELFQDGRPQSFEGNVIDFQAADIDIGVLSFRPGRAVACSLVQPRSETLREGDSVFSWGCNGGENPTRRDTHITRLNRYVGPPNVEAAGAPVQGRSGGGLFNARGELLGVCYAADQELNEGLYCGPEVIYQQLAKLGLQRLYDRTTAPNLAPATTTTPISNVASSAIATPSNPFSATNPSPTPAMTILLRDASGVEQQLKIDAPSPQLLQALSAEASGQARQIR